MENIFIILFIVIANIVALLLTYHSFGKNIDKQKKMLYTMLGFGTMYIIILIIYWLSSIGIENKAASQSSKDMITFTFVPVNTIILLPILIRAYSKVKNKQMDIQTLNKRTIIMLIVGVVLIIGEFFYFRNIQEGIIKMIEEKKNEEVTSQNVQENIVSDVQNIQSDIANDVITNMQTNASNENIVNSQKANNENILTNTLVNND